MVCAVLWGMRLPPLVLAALLLTVAVVRPAGVRADTGHVAVVGGVMLLDEADSTQVRPYYRTELDFRIWGPFELGGHLQMATLSFPFDTPAFGGGLNLQLRPDTNFGGFLPHAEVAGSRVTLPGTPNEEFNDGRVDAWSVSVGAGVGYEFPLGIALELRVHHQWYFDLPENSGVGVDGWTVMGGINYRIP